MARRRAHLKMSSCLSRRPSGSSDDAQSPKLYLITYMWPGLPMGLYQTYQYLLEKVLDCDSRLIVESRWSAPPPGKPDPFTSNEVDIAFLCSTGYVKMLDDGNPNMELLPVAPVFDHPLIERNPVYFSEVIVRKDKEAMFKEFKDLKGHTLGINDIMSLSGNFVILAELKRLGYNASFFANIIPTGSHNSSIDGVIGGGIDCAAIDCLVLQKRFNEDPKLRDELHIVSTLGPSPVPPIVVNKRLPVEIKKKIETALLDVDQYPEMAERFRKFGVKSFVPVDSVFFNRTRELMETVKDQKLFPTYY